MHGRLKTLLKWSVRPPVRAVWLDEKWQVRVQVTFTAQCTDASQLRTRFHVYNWLIHSGWLRPTVHCPSQLWPEIVVQIVVIR